MFRIKVPCLCEGIVFIHLIALPKLPSQQADCCVLNCLPARLICRQAEAPPLTPLTAKLQPMVYSINGNGKQGMTGLSLSNVHSVKSKPLGLFLYFIPIHDESKCANSQHASGMNNTSRPQSCVFCLSMISFNHS